MPAGRPRSFEKDDMLKRVLAAFWQHGYEGTSMAELERATGLMKPSLYAAYGNKEALFRAAADRYLDILRRHLDRPLAQPSLHQGLAQLLRRLVRFWTQEGRPQGCLLVRSLASGGEASEPVRAFLTERRAEIEARLTARLNLAQAQGEIAPDRTVTLLTRYVASFVQGLALQAGSGVPRQELEGVVALFLLSWPQVAGSPSP